MHKGPEYHFWENWNWNDYSPFSVSNKGEITLMGTYIRHAYGPEKYKFFKDSVPITDSVEYNLYKNYLLFNFNSDMSLNWYKKIIDSVTNDAATRVRLNFRDVCTDSEKSNYYVGEAILNHNDSTGEEYPDGTIYLMDGHSIEFNPHGIKL